MWIRKCFANMAGSCSRKLGLSRRRFLQTSGGMAVATLACNEVFGKTREVDPIKALDSSAFAEKLPKTHPNLHSKERSSPDPVVSRDFDKYHLAYKGGTALQDGTAGADINLYDSNKNVRVASLTFWRDDLNLPPNQILSDGTLFLSYQMSRFNDVITTLRYEKPLYVAVNGATGFGYIGTRMWEGTGEQEGV